MPKFVWVAELSTPDAYSKHQALGEVIWDATAANLDYFGWLVIHYPEVLFLNDRDSHNGGIEDYAMADAVPYPIYRHNLCDIATLSS